MNGGLHGGDAVVERIGEDESLIALFQRVLHLRENQMQTRHAEDLENGPHYA